MCCAPVAQGIEQRTSKPKVVGSIPTRRTKETVFMNKFFKVFELSILGGFFGITTWALFYIAHKTPAIEFDGPAFGGMLASAF